MSEFDANLIDNLRRKPRAASQANYAARLAAESRAHHKGKAPTGRTEQLNMRVTAELKKDVLREVEKRDVLLAELLEEMWAAYLANKRIAA